MGSPSTSRQHRDREVDEALFSFYCSSLTRYSRFQSLLLLAYVTFCGKRTEAHEMRREGKTISQIARTLGISNETASRWLWDGPPRVPSWAKRALRELDEYQIEDVADELAEPWRAAC